MDETIKTSNSWHTPHNKKQEACTGKTISPDPDQHDKKETPWFSQYH